MFTNSSFKRPIRKPREKAVKQLKKVSKKGHFWIFVNRILTAFFLKIELPQRCESCDGTSYCGPLTPAHTRRRQDIRHGDWRYAFRVAALGADCHYHIDAKGRREAEPILEKIIADRFKKMGYTEQQVDQLLLECAEQVQAEDAKTKSPQFDEFLVIL